jgi:hypothetical protein
MANIGAAPALAPTRVLIGPVFSHGGLRYWYLACFPDSIVALRQGFGASLVLGMANDDGVPMRGLWGNAALLVNHVLKPRARKYRLRAEAMMGNTPTSQLRLKPNVVYDVTELKVIKCIAKKGAPLILPELVLETKTGGRQMYGVRPDEFKRACELLKQMYPGVWRLA